MDCYWLDHINIYKRMLQSSNDWRFWSILVIFLLVGGSEHEFYFPFHIWDVILPIDELHHFSRWLLHHQAILMGPWVASQVWWRKLLGHCSDVSFSCPALKKTGRNSRYTCWILFHNVGWLFVLGWLRMIIFFFCEVRVFLPWKFFLFEHISGNILFFFGRLYLRRTFLVGCWDKPGNKQIPTDSSLVLLSLLGELPCIPIKGRCIPQSLSLMWTLWFTWPWVNFFQRCPLDLPLHIPVKTIYIKPPKMDGVWLVKNKQCCGSTGTPWYPFFWTAASCYVTCREGGMITSSGMLRLTARAGHRCGGGGVMATGQCSPITALMKHGLLETPPFVDAFPNQPLFIVDFPLHCLITGG